MKSARSHVRVSSQTSTLLRQLAKEANEPMVAIVDQAVERYYRDSFLRAANGDFANLRRNRSAWKEELRERAVWEQTLGDGLDGRSSS